MDPSLSLFLSQAIPRYPLRQGMASIRSQTAHGDKPGRVMQHVIRPGALTCHLRVLPRWYGRTPTHSTFYLAVSSPYSSPPTRNGWARRRKRDFYGRLLFARQCPPWLSILDPMERKTKTSLSWQCSSHGKSFYLGRDSGIFGRWLSTLAASMMNELSLRVVWVVGLGWAQSRK